MKSLGKLEAVPLREVWKHEATDFTQWLALPDNIDQLAEILLGGGSLTVTGTEVSVGKYKADILARDSEDRVVVIENQLGRTDHDHLGKIITYAAGKQADVLVWIVREAREEHESAVNWLNEHTDEHINVFLVQIEAWRIGQSPPAPRFNVIAKPNDWLKTVKQLSEPGSPSSLKLEQRAFFEEIRERGEEHAPHVKSWPEPSPKHWYDVRMGSNVAHIAVTANSQKSYVGVEIYLKTSDTFHALGSHRTAIEAALQMSCDWQELPTRIASRILVTRDGDFRDAAQRNDLVEWAVATTDKFAEVFPGFLQ